MKRDNRSLLLYQDGLSVPSEDPQGCVKPLSELKAWLVEGLIVCRLLSYHHAQLRCYRFILLRHRFVLALILRCLSRRTPSIVEEGGRTISVTLPRLMLWFAEMVRDLAETPAMLYRVKKEIENFRRHVSPPPGEKIDWRSKALYLRTDFVFGLRSGGSLGHIGGVVNHLDRFCGSVLFLTTDLIPTVRKDLPVALLHPSARFLDFNELPELYSNHGFAEQAERLVQHNSPLAFVYQRYSVNNFTGLAIASHYGIPFVFEYNGSEVWIHRHWKRRLRYEKIALDIEKLNLQRADLIVVVSNALRDQLAHQGIVPHKILVNPNGVDPILYSPDTDGSRVRKALGLGSETVIGFIGTFDRWHGTEVLSDAFGRLIHAYPEYRGKVKLLLIGNGVCMPLIKNAISRWNVQQDTLLPGIVPQREGPVFLAACDLLVSPHVPNSDGTPFFGSPTKLFEYMAMGKGIVGSRLDQIGEILKHDHTAWLVEPGNPESLMQGLKTMVDDEALRYRLGTNARREVLEKYTWEKHTLRIIQKLQSLFHDKQA